MTSQTPFRRFNQLSCYWLIQVCTGLILHVYTSTVSHTEIPYTVYTVALDKMLLDATYMYTSYSGQYK